MDTKRYGELTIRVEDIKFSLKFTKNSFRIYIHLADDEVYLVEESQSMHSKTRMEECGIFVLGQHARLYKGYKDIK